MSWPLRPGTPASAASTASAAPTCPSPPPFRQRGTWWTACARAASPQGAPCIFACLSHFHHNERSSRVEKSAVFPPGWDYFFCQTVVRRNDDDIECWIVTPQVQGLAFGEGIVQSVCTAPFHSTAPDIGVSSAIAQAFCGQDGQAVGRERLFRLPP